MEELPMEDRNARLEDHNFEEMSFATSDSSNIVIPKRVFIVVDDKLCQQINDTDLVESDDTCSDDECDVIFDVKDFVMEESDDDGDGDGDGDGSSIVKLGDGGEAYLNEAGKKELPDIWSKKRKATIKKQKKTKVFMKDQISSSHRQPVGEHEKDRLDMLQYKSTWVKPRKGCYRVDTDGSVKVKLKKDGSLKKWICGGHGAIGRDNEGNLVCAAAGVSEPVSVLYHQLEGVKKGLELAVMMCKLHNDLRVAVFTDSPRAYNFACQGDPQEYEGKDSAKVIDILVEIHALLSWDDVIWVMLGVKDNNRAADRLSKLFNVIEITENPQFDDQELKHIIFEDSKVDRFLNMP